MGSLCSRVVARLFAPLDFNARTHVRPRYQPLHGPSGTATAAAPMPRPSRPSASWSNRAGSLFRRQPTSRRLHKWLRRSKNGKPRATVTRAGQRAFRAIATHRTASSTTASATPGRSGRLISHRLALGCPNRATVVPEAVRFSDKLVARCPTALVERVDEAAAVKLMKPSEYVRRAVLRALEADGIDPLTAARAE